MAHRQRLALLFIALLLAFLPACAFRSHTVAPRMGAASLHEATKEDLIERINLEASKIKTLSATVDISAEVGGARKGKVTQFQDIKGYLLVREPDQLRLIGLFPLVRNKAFDMVSGGNEFQLSVPAQNKFIVGRNDVMQPATSSLENLRPQAIFDALLLHVIDKDEEAVLEGGTEDVIDPKTKKVVAEPDYMVDIIRKGQGGPYLSRKIVFSRVDLQPHRQIVYDKAGNIATDAHYENFQTVDNLNFPTTIQILRPQEEYSIVLVIEKLQANLPLKDDQFALQQPAGSTLIRLDQGEKTGLRAGDGQQSQPPAKPKKPKQP